MQFVCQQDGELLLLDPATEAMHTLPGGRTYLDVAELEPGSEVRVVISAGQPAWVMSGPGGEGRSPVTVENLPHFLERHRQADLVIEFDDGDRYPVSALDLTGENPDGEYEITVSFSDCLGGSVAEAHALAAGSPKHSPPGIWWTSDPPSKPVGKMYTPRQIRAVYNSIAGCRVPVYEREPTA
jgi:hypothetical protein